MADKFFDHLTQMPLVAILRGLEPDSAVEVVEALMSQGIRVLEVPLNSPDPFDSMERVAKRFGDKLTIGAGTVLTTEDVDRVAAGGGEIVVSPGVNTAVVRRSLELGLQPIPGIATPSEAFTALEAGATLLKVFPAETLGPGFFGHLGAVLPKDCRLLAVGGVERNNLQDFLDAGGTGVGLGSSLFRPGLDREALVRNAAGFTELIRAGRA